MWWYKTEDGSGERVDVGDRRVGKEKLVSGQVGSVGGICVFEEGN